MDKSVKDVESPEQTEVLAKFGTILQMVRESKHKFVSVKFIVFAKEFVFTKLPPETIVKEAFVAIKFGEVSVKLMICSLQKLSPHSFVLIK